jgi:acyl carrier protein|tara:strand:+ start:1961 stop:2191 length:231 start_codon:yes stop_codon:yes gene_type:complete
LENLFKLIRENFNLGDEFILSDEMGPNNIPGWDSLGGVNLINLIQERLHVEFSLEDMAKLNSIGNILKILKDKGSF